MSATPSETCWILLVKTNAYAGNFERELCAATTGQIGECEVGEQEAQAAQETPSAWLEWCEDHLLQVSDEHGTGRPCSIWQVPGVKQDNGYTGVAIFCDEAPPQEHLAEFKARTLAFAQSAGRFRKPFAVTGFELIHYRVSVKQDVTEF